MSAGVEHRVTHTDGQAGRDLSRSLVLPKAGSAPSSDQVLSDLEWNGLFILTAKQEKTTKNLHFKFT